MHLVFYYKILAKPVLLSSNQDLKQKKIKEKGVKEENTIIDTSEIRKRQTTIKKKNFIYFKITILILNWFFLLTNRLIYLTKYKISFFKKKTFCISFSKAPMAHKTNSHEKYAIQHFSFKLDLYLTFKIFNRFINLWALTYLTSLTFNIHPMSIQKKFFEYNLNYATYYSYNTTK